MHKDGRYNFNGQRRHGKDSGGVEFMLYKISTAFEIEQHKFLVNDIGVEFVQCMSQLCCHRDAVRRQREAVTHVAESQEEACYRIRLGLGKINNYEHSHDFMKEAILCRVRITKNTKKGIQILLTAMLTPYKERGRMDIHQYIVK